jgi:hypothetical protein
MRTAVKFQVLLRARTNCHHLPVETTDSIIGCLHSGFPFPEAGLMKIAAAVLTPSGFLVRFEVVETNWAFALDWLPVSGGSKGGGIQFSFQG